MKRLFISRKLEHGSPILELEKQIEVFDESLIDFEVIPLSQSIESNWIFFYSRKGVKYFNEGNANAGFDINSYKVACMGKGTSEAFKSYFHKESDFVGSGDPVEVYKSFRALLNSGDSITFLCALQSKHSVSNLLKGKYPIQSIPVYKNTKKSNLNIPKCSIGVFTSPLNVESYASSFDLGKLDTLIAIGKTTARKIHHYGIEEVVISVEPSDSGICQAIEISLLL